MLFNSLQQIVQPFSLVPWVVLLPLIGLRCHPVPLWLAGYRSSADAGDPRLSLAQNPRTGAACCLVRRPADGIAPQWNDPVC